MLRKIRLSLFIAAWCSVAAAQSIIGSGVTGDVKVASGGSAITTPILSLGSQSAPSTSAVNFAPLVNGAANGLSASSNREQPVAIAGNISNLFASFPSGIGAGNWSVALTLNGTITTLTCQISGTTCADTTHSVAVVAGNTVGFVTCPGTISGTTCTPGTAPTSNVNIQVSAAFVGTNNNESFVGGQSGPASTSVFNYATLQGFTLTLTTTEVNVSNIIPVAGVLDQFYVSLSTASGPAKSWTFTVMQNGAASTVACNAANTTTCTDLVDSITIAANDTISIQICPGTVAVGVCTSLTPATGALHWGMRWKPTTPGQSLLLMADQVTMPQTAATGFSYINGVGSSGLTEVNNQNIGPLSFTIKNMSVAFSTAPGAAQSRTFTLRTGTGGSQTNSALTCNVTNSTTITACQDSTHSASATSGLFLNWQNAETGTPAAVTNFKISAVATVP